MSYYQPKQLLLCAVIPVSGAMVSFVNACGVIKVNYVVKSFATLEPLSHCFVFLICSFLLVLNDLLASTM